jgi:hypothetical protein
MCQFKKLVSHTSSVVEWGQKTDETGKKQSIILMKIAKAYRKL